MTRSSLIALFVLTAAAPALAGDTWTAPYNGVRYLKRTTDNPKWSIHMLEIDLQADGVGFVSTATGDRAKKTSAWASLKGAKAAINADFFSWSENYKTTGLAAGSGAKWADTSDSSSHGSVVFGNNARIELRSMSEVTTFDSTWMKGAVGGQPYVLNNGNIPNHTGAFCTDRHPRTVVGKSQDGRYFYMGVVDGRQSTLSVGMTCAELGNLMKQLGAHSALNLDGGGSTTFVMGGQIKNSPSDSGGERVVANHLGLIAGAPVQTGTLKGIIHLDGDSTQRISGAVVKITGGPQMTTASDGVYEFQLAPGTYTATATKSGYVTKNVSRTVTSGATVWGSMGLVKVVVDAGTPAVDAGTPKPDAGTPKVDAGTAWDAGTPFDAGVVTPDAGHADDDAGHGGNDDAGVGEQDAGPGEDDAGSGEQDAGEPEADGGGFTMEPPSENDLVDGDDQGDDADHPQTIQGGCTASGPVLALWGVGLAALLLARRRRSWAAGRIG